MSKHDRINTAIDLVDEDMPDGAYWQCVADFAGVDQAEVFDHVIADTHRFPRKVQNQPVKPKGVAQPPKTRPKGMSASGELHRQIKKAGIAGLSECEAEIPWVEERIVPKLFSKLKERGLIERGEDGRWRTL